MAARAPSTKSGLQVGLTLSLLLMLGAAGIATFTAGPPAAAAFTGTPAVRIGDRAEYVVYERTGDQENWQRTDTRTFEILDERTGFDQNLRRGTFTLVGTRDADNAPSVLWLDPISFNVVQKHAGISGPDDVTGWQGSAALIVYGPAADPRSAFTTQVLRWAGNKFPDEPRMLQEWARVLEQILPPTELETSDVIRRAPSLHPAAINDFGVTILTLSGEASVGGRTFDVVREAWLAPDVPYPLGFLHRIHEHGAGTVHDRQIRLAQFERGTQPLTGRAPAGPGGFFDPVPNEYPPEGADARLAASLSDIMERVDKDPALVGYRTWMGLHPDARLVGYRLLPNDFREPGGNGILPVRWFNLDLLFSDADGKGIMLIANWDPLTDAYFTKDAKREVQRPPEFYHRLPKEFITLANAAQAWRVLGAEYGFPTEINSVEWGLQGGCGHVVMPLDCSVTMLERVRVGWHGPWDPGVPGVVAGEWDHGYVELNTSTGEIVSVELTRSAGAGLQHYGVRDPGGETTSIDPQLLAAKTTPLQLPAYAKVSLGLVALLSILELIRRAAVAAFWPAYAKITKSQLLLHETRDRLTTSIRENPGATPTELASMGIAPWSTLIYHLTRLEKERLIRVVREGRAKHYYDPSVDAVDARRDAAQKTHPTGEILRILQGEPGLGLRELSRRVGLAPSSMLRHVLRLERVGLLRAERSPGRTAYHSAR